jgi:hypothetical protein
MEKRILLFMTITMIVVNVYGQKPGGGDKLLTVGILGNNAFLAYKVYKDSVHVNRFGVSGSLSWINTGIEDSYSQYAQVINKKTDSNRNFSGGFFWGKQHNFLGNKRLEPYIGYDISVNVSYSSSYSRTEVVDTLYSRNFPNGFFSNKSHIGDYSFSKTKTPLSIGVSFTPLTGLNYFIFKNFAVGAEFRLTVASLQYGFSGKNTSENKTQGVVTTYHTNVLNSFNAQGKLTGAAFITASYYFK